MSDFEKAINHTLESLAGQFEERFADEAEIDLEDGVLRAEFNDRGTYLLNRHRPLSQLWLSSPHSGAWHFTQRQFADRAQIDWVATRGDKISLFDLLNKELSPTPPFDRS